MDNWENRKEGMICLTCMYFCIKYPETVTNIKTQEETKLGRCRRHAPTMKGWPVMYPTDWCGSHKLDENKIIISDIEKAQECAKYKIGHNCDGKLIKTSKTINPQCFSCDRFVET